MKKLIITALALLAFSAQSAHADGIGLVNGARILKESKAAVAMGTQVQAKQKSFQAEVDAKEKELLAEDQGLAKQRDKMDKDAFEKKVTAFREKAAGVQRQVQEKKASLDKAIAASVEEIRKNLIEVASAVATEKKLSLILSTDQVLYGQPSMDVTNDVLTRLDAKLPTVTVKF